MHTLTQPPSARKRDVSTITATTAEDGSIVLRVETPSAGPPDELVPLADSGLEERAWKALIRRGELPARRIGRRWWTTRSALVALVVGARSEPTKPAHLSSTSDDAAYDALVSRRGLRGRGAR